MSDLLVDTNVIHYAAGSSPQNDVRAFWNSVISPTTVHNLFLSDETVQELLIQSYGMNPDLLSDISKKILPYFNIYKYAENRERERKLIELAAYLRIQFPDIFRVPTQTPGDLGKLMHLPSTGDARIMLTAVDYACDIIVTRNVKDFLVFLALGGEIWDPVTNNRLTLSDTDWGRIQGDPGYQRLKSLI